jgi:hypothetical protein
MDVVLGLHSNIFDTSVDVQVLGQARSNPRGLSRRDRLGPTFENRISFLGARSAWTVEGFFGPLCAR